MDAGEWLAAAVMTGAWVVGLYVLYGLAWRWLGWDKEPGDW
jgi:hypothetical protein